VSREGGGDVGLGGRGNFERRGYYKELKFLLKKTVCVKSLGNSEKKIIDM